MIGVIVAIFVIALVVVISFFLKKRKHIVVNRGNLTVALRLNLAYMIAEAIFRPQWVNRPIGPKSTKPGLPAP